MCSTQGIRVRRKLGVILNGAILTFLAAACASAGEQVAPEPQDAAPVSNAEYRLAKEAELRCVQAAGWSTSELRANLDGVTLGFTIGHSSGDDPMADADACFQQHSASIEAAFISQHMLTGAEKEAALDSLHQCFLEVPVAGALRSDSSKQLLRRAAELYTDPNSPEFQKALTCMDTHQWAITDQADSEG